MFKFGLITFAIGAASFVLLSVPPIGPVGPCASGEQMSLIMIGLPTLPIGAGVLVIWAIRKMVRRASAPKELPSILK
jgi:hypothetical protein